MDSQPSGPWSDLSRPPLRAPALRTALTAGPAAAWRALEVVPSTGSTNADLAERARSGEAEGLVLATDDQRSGRGRLGRSWQAPARSGLAVSVLLRPAEAAPDGSPGTVEQARWSWLPLLAGLAVVDAVTRAGGLPARLKWPNDVLVPRDGVATTDPARLGKVCGILAEVVTTATGPAVILGAGINVSQRPEELPVDTATSLLLAGSATTDRDTLLRAYLRALAVRYRAWRAAGGRPRESGIGAAYREACVTLGCEVAVQLPVGEPVTGVAEGVDDDGRLLVAAGGELRALAAGDVVHVRPPAHG